MTDNITFTLDGVETEVPKGTLVIRAAEEAGIEIPRFCDHPLLEPAGACRQCLVEVELPDREGNLRAMPKPQASCTLEATPGMVVRTQNTSPVADKAQKGVLELLLINHPLDCPICDKGGECPLQNQALSHGHAETRFIDVKRTFPKPISVSTQILLDRERCVLCQRCTRFSKQIAGDAFIDLQKRGAQQQIGRFDEAILGFAQEPAGGCQGYAPRDIDTVARNDIAGLAHEELAADAYASTPQGETPVGAAEVDESGQVFSSYFSGNTVQICPVGALTSAAYRFRSRPFDLVSTPAISEHDSSGSAIRVDHRRGTVMRRLAGNDPLVNEEWITDKDRFAFTWQNAPGRLTQPLVRDRNADGTRGELREASWAEAIKKAAAGLQAAHNNDVSRVAVLPGGRLTIEDAYAYAKFARVALHTNNIDYRARSHSDEELNFLGSTVAGSGVGVTFRDLEAAKAVLLVGFEPEEEGGIVFLRLRKAARKGTLTTYAIAPYATRGIQRIGEHGATLLRTAPGDEARTLSSLTVSENTTEELTQAAADLRNNAIIIVGERLATSPGAYTAVLKLADETGARVAWIPRRAGERGAVEMGALPSLLPGGRPVSDNAARIDLAAAWNIDSLPAEPGHDVTQIVDGLINKSLSAVVLGGLELSDLPQPQRGHKALESADFVVSLEVRESDVTPYADVVFPVAPPTERAGAYWNWEGRVRPFGRALTTSAQPDHRVLSSLADALGLSIALGQLEDVRRDIDQLGVWDGARTDKPDTAPVPAHELADSEAVLATWHQLLDAGALQTAERFLAGTAKTPVVRVHTKTAAKLGVTDGEPLTVSTPHGQITLPVALTDIAENVVWLPLKSPGSFVYETLGVDAGAVVTLHPALVAAHVGAPEGTEA
ncbi:NADH-quinone oxidoreductase subunit G [Timonella sp. A28]|uniref:NADH-quinone oxidoreductase subunit G n=1 Tax=Timonella sp. A28 TaxID=3442640 RepID=UPI003EB76E6F